MRNLTLTRNGQTTPRDVTFTAAKAKEPAAAVPEVVTTDAASGFAQQLTALYRRAESAKGEFVRHAVAFGVKLMEAEMSFVSAATKLNSTSKRGRIGEGRPNSGIEDWLAANCPEINYKTARGYKSLASKMVALMGGETPEVMAALAAPSERLISYEGFGAETDQEPGDVLTVSEETIRMRDEIFAEAPSRRKLRQMWLNLFGGEDGADAADGKKAKRKAAAAAESGDGLSTGDSATLLWADAMKPFVANRAAFHSAARDLRADVAERFLDELRMLVGALERRVEGK